ncbi:MAG: PAS domain S-box protein [Candidatus Sigynarchaeota archaeon]
MEAHLDKDEKFLSEIFASIDEGFIIIDNGKVKYVNDQASQILGYPKEEIAEKGFVDFAASDGDRSAIQQYLDSVLHHRRDIRELSFWVMRKDGTRAYVHCHFHYPREDPALYRYIIIADITDLFRADSIIRIQRDLAVKVGATSDLATIYKACLDVMLEVGSFDTGVVFETDEPGKFRPVFKINIPEEMVDWYVGQRFNQREGFSQFMKGTPIYRENLRSKGPDFPIGCASMLPLLHKGAFLGVIVLLSQRSMTVPTETRRSLETIAAQMGSAIARARAESALHASEEKFRNISEQMTEGVSITVENKIVWVNEAYCAICGYSPEELIGKDLELILHPSEIPRLLQNLKDAMAGKPAQRRIETVGIHKSGRQIDLEFSGTIITYNGVPAVLTIVRDITERKKAERELRESEEKFRLISEHVGDIVALLDERMHLLFCNEKSLIEKLGITNKELSQKSISTLVYRDDQERMREIIAHVTSKRSGYAKGEIRFLHKDGRPLWFWIEASSYFDANGNLRGLLTARDINEKKEQELKLAESEKKYRLISENSNDLIFVLDEKATTHYVNEGSLLKILGYTTQDIKSITVDALLHPDDVAMTRDVMRAAIEKPGNMLHNEVRIKHKSGNNFIWFDFECLGFNEEGGARRLLLVGRDIQGRKEQELKLKESEERYRLLLENTSDLVFLYDKNLNILYANEQVIFKKLELGVDAFSKNRISDIVHPEDVIALLSAINYVKTRPLSTQQRELRIAHRNGHHRWFNAEFSSSTDLVGQIRIIGIFRDIHERKLQSLKLKQSEERYRLISENVNDIIILLDTELNLLYCNERALFKKLGFLASEFNKFTKPAGAQPSLIHPDDLPVILEFVQRLRKQPGVHEKHEIRISTKDGKYIWFDIDATSYTDEQAQNRLLFVGRDIQDKKENESKLIESIERLNLITENVQDNIAIINQQGKVEYINRMRQHAAVSTSSILGSDAGFLVHQDDAEKVKRFIAECFQKGHAVTMHRAIDQPSGEVRWYETIGNTFKDKDGNLKLLTISRDISERKKIEGLLENENLLLKEIDKMRKEFVLNATHELKTPLSIIIGATDFLSRYYSDIPDAKRIEFLGSIRKGSTRLKQLIETLLDYSRLESGRLQLQQLEDADIGEMVHASIQNLAYLINRRQHEIMLDIPRNIHAMVDKFRIEQVIVNLISNAVKNTPPRGTIRIELAQKGDQVHFSVTDTGVGLTPEEMSRIFKKFGKIERKGLEADIDIQGTGLGLFISKEIVDMHHGKIWAESAGRNRGSKFSFSIPVRAE